MKIKKPKYILAIETSCDDTSVAIYNNNHHDVITISSSKEQSEFGGVVPELASRFHEKNLYTATKKLLDKNSISFDDIYKIAYTSEPGLKVCINMGKVFAKTLSFLYEKELKEINHIYSHLFSFSLNNIIVYPFIGLVASGGHTSIYLVRDKNNIELLNETLDDAIGEVYDKIARVLKFEYPGGPIIDSLYNESKTSINFLNRKINPANQFSFSGIKSAVLNYIIKNKEFDKIEVISSFQKLIISIVIDKIIYYSDLYNIRNIVIGGGVAANKLLRKELIKQNFHLSLPNLDICGDNALMIGLMAKILED